MDSPSSQATAGEKTYALIGAAGFVAPRHMKAIRDTGGRLVAALDPHDSVGVLDSFGYDIAFFTEFERFDRHIEKLRREGAAGAGRGGDGRGGEGRGGVDFVSIASPNYLHDAHIRFALRVGADAICEKPLVLNPWNVDALAEVERETGRRIYNVLQLRVHPAVVALRERVLGGTSAGGAARRHRVKLTYITSRGQWYSHSWKGVEAKSGGVATNIGVHFFDMLLWIFGPVRGGLPATGGSSETGSSATGGSSGTGGSSATGLHVSSRSEKHIGGVLELEHADVEWFLSVDAADLPDEARAAGMPTWRRLELDGEAFEFSGGFTDLHTRVYEDILAGRGFGLADARPAIDLVHALR